MSVYKQVYSSENLFIWETKETKKCNLVLWGKQKIIL